MNEKLSLTQCLNRLACGHAQYAAFKLGTVQLKLNDDGKTFTRFDYVTPTQDRLSWTYLAEQYCFDDWRLSNALKQE